MASRKGANVNLEWDISSLLNETVELNTRTDNLVAGVLKNYDSRIEAFMKVSAPWTDRTGNARAGMRAEYEGERFGPHYIRLWGSMPYNIWLEVRFAGKYAIILPTIIAYGPKIMATLNKGFKRLNSGSAQ